jgi:hypothetical protein
MSKENHKPKCPKIPSHRQLRNNPSIIQNDQYVYIYIYIKLYQNQLTKALQKNHPTCPPEFADIHVRHPWVSSNSAERSLVLFPLKFQKTCDLCLSKKCLSKVHQKLKKKTLHPIQKHSFCDTSKKHPIPIPIRNPSHRCESHPSASAVGPSPAWPQARAAPKLPPQRPDLG